MSTNAGNLLWNRKRILSLPAGVTAIDTGLRQANMSFESSSVDEPDLGIPGVAAPAPGELPASRVQVIPQAPTGKWANITHSEPWYNTATKTVWVTFTNAGEAPVQNLNALFWDPHTLIGPGQADTYNEDNR
jgi:hypothetical protein